MAVSSDPATVTKAAACFDCVPPKLRDAVELYLLASINGGSLDPKVLTAAAACFACIPHEMVEPTKLYLLDAIAAKVGA